jgi:alpha-N-acetylglucosamine transferase
LKHEEKEEFHNLKDSKLNPNKREDLKITNSVQKVKNDGDTNSWPEKSLKLISEEFNPPLDILTTSTTTQTRDTNQKFAYAFFATTLGHACGTLVNIAALKEAKVSDQIDFVILTYGFHNDPVQKQAAKMKNVIVKEVQHLKNFKGGSLYYKNVMVKLRIFQLFEYDRIIFMDCDMMVRKNLDHLFFLPDNVHFAAPYVYYDGKSSNFCSCFMVFQPKQRLWDRIMAWYKPDGYVNQTNLYDMDLLNLELKRDVTHLPGMYELLTSHIIHPNEWESLMKEKPFIPQKLSMMGKTQTEIYNASKIFHFTPKKPTIDKTLSRLKVVEPAAHPLLYAVFERYFSLAADVCPFMNYEKSNEYSHYW